MSPNSSHFLPSYRLPDILSVHNFLFSKNNSAAFRNNCFRDWRFFSVYFMAIKAKDRKANNNNGNKSVPKSFSFHIKMIRIFELEFLVFQKEHYLFPANQN